MSTATTVRRCSTEHSWRLCWVAEAAECHRWHHFGLQLPQVSCFPSLSFSNPTPGNAVEELTQERNQFKTHTARTGSGSCGPGGSSKSKVIPQLGLPDGAFQTHVGQRWVLPPASTGTNSQCQVQVTAAGKGQSLSQGTATWHLLSPRAPCSFNHSNKDKHLWSGAGRECCQEGKGKR